MEEMRKWSEKVEPKKKYNTQINEHYLGVMQSDAAFFISNILILHCNIHKGKVIIQQHYVNIMTTFHSK